MIRAVLLASAFLLTIPAGIAAQSSEPDQHAADRALLLELLAKVEQALNQHDADAIAPYLHPQVVMTYQNAEVTTGIEQAKAFYSRMLIGPDAVVKDFSTKAEVSAPAVFYANTAVAYGTTTESYTLAEGLDFTLDTRWTATVTKEGDGWKVAALHFSSNLFDNPVLAGVQKTLWMAGAGGLVGGMLLMFVLGRLVRR